MERARLIRVLPARPQRQHCLGGCQEQRVVRRARDEAHDRIRLAAILLETEGTVVQRVDATYPLVTVGGGPRRQVTAEPRVWRRRWSASPATLATVAQV